MLMVRDHELNINKDKQDKQLTLLKLIGVNNNFEVAGREPRSFKSKAIDLTKDLRVMNLISRPY